VRVIARQSAWHLLMGFLFESSSEVTGRGRAGVVHTHAFRNRWVVVRKEPLTPFWCAESLDWSPGLACMWRKPEVDSTDEGLMTLDDDPGLLLPPIAVSIVGLEELTLLFFSLLDPPPLLRILRDGGGFLFGRPTAMTLLTRESTDDFRSRPPRPMVGATASADLLSVTSHPPFGSAPVCRGITTTGVPITWHILDSNLHAALC
jgi:hypothetical protein